MEKSEIPEEVLNGMEGIKVQEKEKSLEGEILGFPVKEIEKCEELEEWKERVAKAEKQKNEMLLVKLNSDSKRKQYEDELTKLKERKRVVQEDYQKDLFAINEQNNVLRKEIQFLQMKLAEEKAKYEEYVQGPQLKKIIPEKKMKFVRSEDTKNVESHMTISCFIRVASKIPFKLSQGEALITFDEEDGRKVVQGLIKKHGHYVNIENKKKLVKAQPVTLGTGITFELQANISGSEVSVSNIPELNIPEECMRDKLEVSLRRANLGEVNHVAYDKKSQTAVVAFDSATADNDPMRCGQCPFHAHGRTYCITISPMTETKLQDFQIYSGICRRTMLLREIEVAEEDEETAEEVITIHFQKPSNGGGEVENVKYISNGSKIVYFENDQ